jgi:hypothetical protein
LKVKEKQNKWQDFITGKGSKKKAGFFTGAKKESMFAVGAHLGVCLDEIRSDRQVARSFTRETAAAGSTGWLWLDSSCTNSSRVMRLRSFASTVVARS